MPYKTDGKMKPKEGSLVFSPEEQERFNKRKAAERFNRLVRQNSSDYGGFTFLSTEMGILQSLNPATVGRLAYLSTYLDFGNQLLLKPKNEPMRKKDLPEILNINRQTANEFYNQCINAEMLFDFGNEGLYMNSMFYRGKSDNSQRTRLYRDTIQQLYKKLEPKEHKYFGYIVMLVPLINVEWNIVCENPHEQDSKLLKPLSFKEICKALGYNYGHSNRLKEALTRPIFQWEGHKQPLCGIFTANTEFGTQNTMIVNPNIMFAGTHYENVAAFEAMFCPHNG